MRLRRLLPAAAALFLVAAGPSRPAKPPADPREAQVEELILENGLKVLLWENKAAPLVSVWTWYRVGSRHEQPGASGLSHLLEHLTFAGTEGIPKEAFTATVDKRGGRWNGYTWLDQTAYYETAARDALPDLLELEAQRMTKALLSAADFESERSAVMAELAASETNPTEVLHREVVAAAFKAHPYHWPTLGWSSDLAGITREEVVAHYQQRYHPANATLVVVGDLDRVAVAKLVQEKFGALERRPLPPVRNATEPPQQGERRVSISRPGSTRLLQVSWRAPAFGDPDFAAYLVADAVLAGAKGTNLWAMADVAAPRTSRLHAKVVANGLATHASSSLVPTTDPFLDSVRVTLSETADATAVEAAVVDAVEGLAANASDADVERAKAQIAAKLVFESASVTDLAHQLGFFDTVGGADAWRAFFRLPAAVKKVTTADVKRVAAKYWTSDARTVGWYLPPPSKRTGGGKTGSAAPSSLARYSGAPLATAMPGGVLAAAPVKPAPASGPAITRTVLPNGLVVLAVRNPLAPELVVRVDASAGSAWETADKAGLAALTARLIPSGSAKLDEAGVALAFDAVGATLDVAVDEERASVTARMLVPSADALVPVLRDLVMTPSFPPAAVERERTAALESARDRSEDPRTAAEATLRAALYPAVDARGRDPRGATSTLAPIGRADVADFHKRVWRPDTTVITISGDLDTASAVRLVKKSFGGWRANGAKPTRGEPGASVSANPGWIGRIHFEGRPRTDLVLGWEGPARNHADWLALRAANTALGEIGLGGRIGRVLRDEKGIAEYAWSSVGGGSGPGASFVRAGIDPKKTDEALTAIRGVLTQVSSEGITDAELADAKTLLTGELAHRWETNLAAAAFLADLEHWKLGADYPKKHAAQVDALTRERVAEAAKTWIRPDAIGVTAGPR